MTESSMPQTARLLVCVGPSLSSAGLIRTARKMAAGLQAEWFAVYVESPQMLRLPEAERLHAVQNLRLAEQLGGEAITLRGQDIAAEVVNFARQRQVSMILIGKPVPRPRWQDWLARSPVDDWCAGAARSSSGSSPGSRPNRERPPPRRRPCACRAMNRPVILHPGHRPLFFDVSLLRPAQPHHGVLLAVTVTAIHCGRGPALLNSLLSVLAFDFCFVPPRWTFTVDEAKYIVTFVVMFIIAVDQPSGRPDPAPGRSRPSAGTPDRGHAGPQP